VTLLPADPDFDITTHWQLDARAAELSAIVLDAEQLHLWCPNVFMHGTLVDKGAPDGLGITIRLHTKGWLPHSFLFIAKIVEVVPNKSMTIAVKGDFNGAGYISLSETPDGQCAAKLRWVVEIEQPLIRRIVRILNPIFVLNHLWSTRQARKLMQAEVYRRRKGANQFAVAKPTFPHNLPGFRKRHFGRAAPLRWDENKNS